MIKQLPIIGVLGSGKDEWVEIAQTLGSWIASQGYHLLTGGGKGVMTSVARGFVGIKDRQGLSLGVVPTEASDRHGFVTRDGYPNPWVEFSIVSPLPVFDGSSEEQVSRNHILVLTSDILIALPGNKGTLNEVKLALRFGKPVLLLGPLDAFTNFPEEAQRSQSLSEAQAFISRIADLKCRIRPSTAFEGICDR